MRNVLLSGSGGGAGLNGFTGSGGSAGSGFTVTCSSTGSSGGAPAHAASASAKSARIRWRLVTEPDAQHVDLRRTQAAAQHVEFVEVFGRPDIDAVVITIVDHDALDV